MRPVTILEPEWERIDLLGLRLTSVRRGADISDEMVRRLGVLHQEIRQLRSQAPWLGIVEGCSLNPMDQDMDGQLGEAADEFTASVLVTGGPFSVIDVTPADGAILAAPPTAIKFTFSGPVLGDSVDVSDLVRGQ